jgi:hypothetical protein
MPVHLRYFLFFIIPVFSIMSFLIGYNNRVGNQLSVFEAEISLSSVDTIELGREYFIRPEQLSWKFYKGPVRDPNLIAETYCIMRMTAPSGMKDGFYTEPFHVWIVINTGYSWVSIPKDVDEYKRNFLLEHERTHYKIGVIYTKLFKKEFLSTKVDSVMRMDIRKKYFSLGRLRNEQFDLETKHGSTKDAELKWESLINSELKALRSIKLTSPYNTVSF